MTRDIKVTGVAANTNVAFKNCAIFTRSVIHLNDEDIDTSDNLDIIMPMYNLIEYSDNHADSSGSLYQFKRDVSPMNDAGNTLNVALVNSTSFKYKLSLFGKATDADGNDRSSNNIKIVVPLKYLCIFRSLEMSLVNCKIHLKLNWYNNCVIYGADTYAGGDNVNNREGTFQITSTKLYVPICTLSTKDNANLAKQLNEGEFKRSVYWNEYKSKIETKEADANNLKRFLLDASFQGVNRLFVLAFGNAINGANKAERDSHSKYFLSRVNITNYNILIDSRNFYDQPINDQIKKYDEIRKITTRRGDDYTTGCLLDHQYFKSHYQLIVINLSQQKEFDADPRAIQQIEFYGKLETNSQVCTVLEKSKETVLGFKKEQQQCCKNI